MSPRRAKRTSSREEALQRLVDDLASRRHLHHVVVSVQSGDGSFRWAGASGHAQPGGAVMGEHTPYNIASIDKLFVASAVLKLHEAERLSIDDRLATYLPAELLDGLHRLDGVDHSGAITLRHLLSHTSGIPDSLEDRARGEATFLDRLLAEGDEEWTLADAVRRAARMRPYFAPQQLDTARPRARYSSTNFELLMLVLEQVTGMPIQAVLREQLFDPLGLRHTRMDGPVPPGSELVEPATLWAGDEPLDLPLAMASIPTIYSTAGDTITVLKALMQGELFDQPATLALMQGRWVRFGFPRDRAALRAPNWPIEYGLGIKRFQQPRWAPPFWNVPAVVGHTGSTGTWLFCCPELDLYTAGTVDQVTAGGAVPYRILPRILQICSGHWPLHGVSRADVGRRD